MAKANQPGVGRGHGVRTPHSECVCTRCGETFLAKRSDAQFCEECRKVHIAEHARRQRPERNLEPGIGKGAYTRQPKFEFTCESCHGSFTAKRPAARWCVDCAPKVQLANRRAARATEQNCTCQRCGISFTANRSDAKWCSACKPLVRTEQFRKSDVRRLSAGTCEDCGTPCGKRARICRDCQRAKLRSQQGEANPSWKGGRVKQSGYWYVKQPDGSYKAEHRLVWEAGNGPIPDLHEVHHYNGIRDDNRPENLMAMSKAEHHHNHRLYEERILELEAENAALRAQLATHAPTRREKEAPGK